MSSSSSSSSSSSPSQPSTYVPHFCNGCGKDMVICENPEKTCLITLGMIRPGMLNPNKTKLFGCINSKCNASLVQSPCCGRYLCYFCKPSVSTCQEGYNKLNPEDQKLTKEAKDCQNKVCFVCANLCFKTGLQMCDSCYKRHEQNDKNCECHEAKKESDREKRREERKEKKKKK